MNSRQLYDMLLGYPVTICTADQLKIQRGRFFISNTDTSQGPGNHWVAFYFLKRGPFEFFDSLGHMAKDYGVGFEKKSHVTAQLCFSPFCLLYKPDGEGPCQPKVNTQAGLRLRCVSRFLCSVKIVRIINSLHTR